jgi:hypothetical protein
MKLSFDEFDLKFKIWKTTNTTPQEESYWF